MDNDLLKQSHALSQDVDAVIYEPDKVSSRSSHPCNLGQQCKPLQIYMNCGLLAASLPCVADVLGLVTPLYVFFSCGCLLPEDT